MYEIIDNNGIIHSGNEEEMTEAFDIMTNPDKYSTEDIALYECSWTGDLKLIKVIATHNQEVKMYKYSFIDNNTIKTVKELE